LEKKQTPKVHKLRGRLRVADAAKEGESGVVELVNEKDQSRSKIRVPLSMMNDVVRQHFGEVVEVKVQKVAKGRLELLDVDPVE